MKNVIPCPVEITDIVGGSSTSHGPASQYRYTGLISTQRGTIQLSDLVPKVTRYPDTIDVTPIQIGTLCPGFLVGDTFSLSWRELPFFAPCGPADAGTPDLIRTVSAMSPAQKAALRAALGITP